MTTPTFGSRHTARPVWFTRLRSLTYAPLPRMDAAAHVLFNAHSLALNVLAVLHRVPFPGLGQAARRTRLSARFQQKLNRWTRLWPFFAMSHQLMSETVLSDMKLELDGLGLEASLTSSAMWSPSALTRSSSPSSALPPAFPSFSYPARCCALASLGSVSAEAVSPSFAPECGFPRVVGAAAAFAPAAAFAFFTGVPLSAGVAVLFDISADVGSLQPRDARGHFRRERRPRHELLWCLRP